MNDLPAYAPWKTIVSIAGLVLLYYAGTRGIVLLTKPLQGRWHRRALVSLSFAILFAPSLIGVAAGGMMPAPAWAVAIQYGAEGLWAGVLKWGVGPILICWLGFFVLAQFGSSLMSQKNNNNKVDTHGTEP